MQLAFVFFHISRNRDRHLSLFAPHLGSCLSSRLLCHCKKPNLAEGVFSSVRKSCYISQCKYCFLSNGQDLVLTCLNSVQHESRKKYQHVNSSQTNVSLNTLFVRYSNIKQLEQKLYLMRLSLKNDTLRKQIF